MKLRIPLSADFEARIRECAAAAGKDLPIFVAEAIAEKLNSLEEFASSTARHPISGEQWIAELRAWAASHPRSGAIADDSRENIYGGRDG